jgi:hypothetical protein
LKNWIPAFAGMATFYETLVDNVQDIVNSKDGQDIVYSVLGDVV